MKYTGKQIMDEYLALDDTAESHARIAQLVKMKACPPEILAEVSREPKGGVSFDEARHEAIRNPKLPQDVIEEHLQKVARLGSGGSYRNVIYPYQSPSVYIFENPSVTADAFRRALQTNKRTLGKAYDVETKRFFMGMILAHSNAPVELIEEALSLDNNAMKAKLASNKNLAPRVIQALLWEPNYIIRRELVRNKSIPVETFIEWIDRPLRAPNGKLRGGQHRVIQVLIKRLPKGEDKDRAITYLRSFNNGQATRLVVARHATKGEHLHKVALDNDFQIRDALMKNQDAPEEYKVISALNNQRY